MNKGKTIPSVEEYMYTFNTKAILFYFLPFLIIKIYSFLNGKAILGTKRILRLTSSPRDMHIHKIWTVI